MSASVNFHPDQVAVVESVSVNVSLKKYGDPVLEAGMPGTFLTMSIGSQEVTYHQISIETVRELAAKLAFAIGYLEASETIEKQNQAGQVEANSVI